MEEIQLIYFNLNCIKSKNHGYNSGDNKCNIGTGINNKNLWSNHLKSLK